MVSSAKVLYDSVVQRVRLNWSGAFPCEPDWSWDTAITPFRDFDLWAVFRGRGTLLAPDARFELSTGDCLVLRPGERYVCSHRADDPLLVHVIHYDYLDGDGKISRPEDLPPVHKLLTDVTFFRGLTTRVVTCNAAGRQDEAEVWLRACLRELARSNPGHHLSDARARGIERLCTQIMETPSRRWSVTEVARSFDLSPDHFTRLFKEVKGVSLREFISRARIESARRLLLSSSHSITRIAALTGFGDIYHFSRQFRRRTGRSPSSFRMLGPD